MKMRRRSRRRYNPHRVRRHRRRGGFRRNPGGFFSEILAPVKEHGLGFAVGAGFNQFVADPLLAQFLPPVAIGPGKIFFGPMFAALARRAPFLKKFPKVWNSLALFMVAVGINDTVHNLMGTAPSAAHGFANIYGRRNAMRSIGPTSGVQGMGSIGPTSGSGVQGLGALTASETYAEYGDGTGY
jgi:hypothetical protein